MQTKRSWSMKKQTTSVNGYAASKSAESTSENMQWTKYHNTNGGHGIAAEDSTALLEKLLGHKIELVGINNAKNGPDLLIDGVPVQLKYYNNAGSTIESCFDSNGMFRYSGQQIMVPKDQYAEAVARMRDKIAQGKVPGVNDPNAAESIIRKGRLTHRQAVNLKKAGTKESLAFDTLTQLRVAGFIGGIAAGMAFIEAKRNGASNKEASVTAGQEFGKTGIKALVGGVATQQFLRTATGRKAAAVATHAARKVVKAACNSNVGKKFVEKVAHGVGGKALSGATARTVTTKAIRGNIITSTMMFVVDSIPDTCRLCRGKMSLADFGKSRATGAAGVAGGSAGYMAGMAIGTAICPGIGTAVGGFVGGILGGMGGTTGMRKVISCF